MSNRSELLYSSPFCIEDLSPLLFLRQQLGLDSFLKTIPYVRLPVRDRNICVRLNLKDKLVRLRLKEYLKVCCALVVMRGYLLVNKYKTIL